MFQSSNIFWTSWTNFEIQYCLQKEHFWNCSHYSNPEHIFQLWTLFWTCEHLFNNVNKFSNFIFYKSKQILKKVIISWKFGNPLSNFETWTFFEILKRFFTHEQNFEKQEHFLGFKNFKTTNIFRKLLNIFWICEPRHCNWNSSSIIV